MKIHANAERLDPASSAQDVETRLRVRLAAFYRLMAFYRMTDHIYTHISVKIPGTDHFLINDYGLMFHEICASNLVKVDMHCNVLAPLDRPVRVNIPGFTIHSAVHMAREDLTCVAHAHTAAGIALSAQEEGLLPLSQHALKFYGRLSYHGYEGFAADEEERERLAADLGPTNKVMILRNHGVLACGRTVADAFLQLYYLERACQAQIAATSGGRRLVLPPEEICRRTSEQFAALDVGDNMARSKEASPDHADVSFDAAVRQIAKDQPPYWT